MQVCVRTCVLARHWQVFRCAVLQLREDLGGVRFTPTFLVVFYDMETKLVIYKAEGTEEVRMALQSGKAKNIIKAFVDKRIKLKLSERLAEEFAGALQEEQRRRARQVYESKLRQEREEMERKEQARLDEEKQKLQEEKKKREEAEQQAYAAKLRLMQERQRRRPQVVESLLKMDLNTCRIRELKDKMEDLGISHVGYTSRPELIERLKQDVPELGQTGVSSSTPSSYNPTSAPKTSMIGGSSIGGEASSDVSKLQRINESLTRNIEELELKRQQLDNEKESLQRQLKDKSEELRKKDEELNRLKSVAVSLCFHNLFDNFLINFF